MVLMSDLTFSLCLSVLSVFLRFLGEISVFFAAKSSRIDKLINKFGVFGAESRKCVVNLSSLTDEIRHNIAQRVLIYYREEAEPVSKKSTD